jgi:hypothetical protein
MQADSAGSESHEERVGMPPQRTSKKDRQREQLIIALLQQPSLEKAAAVAGMSVVTAWRISKTEEFQKEYRQARRDAFSQSIVRLQQASGAAVATLMKVMVDPKTPAASRVRAADCVLDHGAKSIEIEDIEARVATLERVEVIRTSGG